MILDMNQRIYVVIDPANGGTRTKDMLHDTTLGSLQRGDVAWPESDNPTLFTDREEARAEVRDRRLCRAISEAVAKCDGPMGVERPASVELKDERGDVLFTGPLRRRC